MYGTRMVSIGGIALFFLAWELAVRSGTLTQSLVPLPSVLPATFLRELRSGVWPHVVMSSLQHYSRGLVAGTFLGITVGAAISIFPRFRVLQAYLARLLRPIPPLAWIPFAIIWFGITRTAATFIIAIGVFWINYFATSEAIDGVDRDYVEVARVFGQGGFFALLRKVMIPAASPGILTGVRTGIGQAWMTVVAAELFGITGIGQRMIEASGLLATDIVVVYMLTIAVLYGITDGLFGLVQGVILRWHRL